ncbi:MAG: decaprenyl-phosphate phosphoribosyltransferase [Lapillicoccus sp.]
MTIEELPATSPVAVAPARVRRTPRTAVLRAVRPRQWPKNLLVLAAPVAAGSLGDRPAPLLDAALAGLAFLFASWAIYLVNDVVDAERDRGHPRKRHRPVAAGDLSPRGALTWAALAAAGSIAAALAVQHTWLVASVLAYLVLSLLYCLGLKHVPVLEIVIVASGFLLRGLGGAAALQIPPTLPFTLVYTLCALVVVVAKRANERMSMEVSAAAHHRPSLVGYDMQALRWSSRLLMVAAVGSYAVWAITQTSELLPHLHLLTVVPLAGAFVRFDQRVTRDRHVQVEEIFVRDGTMLMWEAVWLALFAVSASS